MSTSSAMSQLEENLSTEGTAPSNFACETCRMPLGGPHDLNNNMSEMTDLNTEEIEDIIFIENLQMLAGSLENGISRSQSSDDKSRREIIRPLLSKSNDLGRLNIETLGLMTDSPKVEHPLCRDCVDNILDYMDQKLKYAEDDLEDYRELWLLLEKEVEAKYTDELKEQLLKYEALEMSLLEVLSQMETQKDQIKEEIRGLRKDCEILEEETNKMLLRNPESRCLQLKDSLSSLENQITYVKNRHDKLDKTNAFRLAFHILCDGTIGIINGYRLGRLPNTTVSWAEINLAWAQTVLLLHSLSKLLNFTPENFELVPMSNRSYVKSIQRNKAKLLPLFYFGEENKTIKLMEFDQAMVGFLNYFQKFKETIEEKDTICLPYPIQNSKIIDGRNGKAYSVKLQLNTEENWTKALKFVLTNLRWAVAWSSKMIEK